MQLVLRNGRIVWEAQRLDNNLYTYETEGGFGYNLTLEQVQDAMKYAQLDYPHATLKTIW